MRVVVPVSSFFDPGLPALRVELAWETIALLQLPPGSGRVPHSRLITFQIDDGVVWRGAECVVEVFRLFLRSPMQHEDGIVAVHDRAAANAAVV